ncbi:unnamed protein product, partial [Oppiella nova]
MPTVFQMTKNFLKNNKSKKHHYEQNIINSFHSSVEPTKPSAAKKSSKKKVNNSMNQTEGTNDKKKAEKKSEVSNSSLQIQTCGPSGANEQRLPLFFAVRRVEEKIFISKSWEQFDDNISWGPIEEQEVMSKDSSNGMTNSCKSDALSAKKQTNFKSNKCEVVSHKVRKGNSGAGAASGTVSSQVVHSSADKRNANLCDDSSPQQMSLWPIRGTALSAPHNSIAISDRLTNYSNGTPIVSTSLFAQNSIDETIELCIRKYSQDFSDHSSEQVSGKRRKHDNPCVDNNATIASHLDQSGHCLPICSTSTCDINKDVMRSRSSCKARDKTTSAQRQTSRRSSSAKKPTNETSRQSASNTSHTTKSAKTSRDLKSTTSDKSANCKPHDKQCTQTLEESVTNGTEVRSQTTKRKRPVNKTGFTKPRKRVRTSAQPSPPNPVKPTQTVAAVNGKRHHVVAANHSNSVCHKRTVVSSDKNVNSSHPSSRCRAIQDNHKSAVNKNNTINSKNRNVKQNPSLPVVNDKVSTSLAANKRSNGVKKLDKIQSIPPPKKPPNVKKCIKHERRLSKASIDSVSSSEAYLSEQSCVSDAPVYMVTEPSVKSKVNNKKIYRIKSFQRNIPYKKYLKSGNYSEDSKTDKSLVNNDSNDGQKIEKTSADEDMEIVVKDEPKAVQKLIQLPVLDYDFLEDFVLPFDLWYQFDKNQSSNLKNPANYKRIKNNVFCDVKPLTGESVPVCSCEKPSPSDDNKVSCGMDCLNRLMYQECSPQLCPTEEYCQNQRIQKHDWSPGLERFMTGDRGWGIRTTEQIKNGEFILEYIGEVVSEARFKDRMAKLYQNDLHHYCLNIDSGIVIDGYRMADEGRFVNHSCEPNCEMQKWSVNGLYRIGLFAKRNILPNEELSYDYNFQNFNVATQQVCRCGSAKCRGYIGGRSQRVNSSGSKDKTEKNETKNKDISVTKQSEESHRNRRKDMHQTKSGSNSTSNNNNKQSLWKPNLLHPMKLLSHQSSCYILRHRCFLLRNYEKLRRLRNKRMGLDERERKLSSKDEDFVKGKEFKSSNDSLMNTLMTLNSSRSVRTRGLAKAESNEELTRTAKLAQIFTDVCDLMIKKQNEMNLNVDILEANKSELKSSSNTSTNKQKSNVLSKCLDLSEIQSQIKCGFFKSVDTFESEFMKTFNSLTSGENNENMNDNEMDSVNGLKSEFYKIISEKKPFIEDIMSSADSSSVSEQNSQDMPSVAAISKSDSLVLASDSANKSVPNSNPLVFANPNAVQQNNASDDKKPLISLKTVVSEEEEEEVIRCICGILRDEGKMIQCDKCEIWQHCECVGVKDSIDSYFCEVCEPRAVPTEIPLPQSQEHVTNNGKTDYMYYLTLMCNGLHIKTGDCVYIYRTKEEDKHTNRKTSPIKALRGDSKTDYIIFRVQNLAIKESGKKLLYGHHYLRPSETYHEPSRKFYDNEVLKSPLTEWVPIEEVKGICCVLDASTYVKGRPKGFQEEDVYICEYRVDRHAKSFARIPSKSIQFVVNTKSYAFDMFETKLNIKRTYSCFYDQKPHRVPESYCKSKTVTKNAKTDSETKAKKDIEMKQKRMADVLKLNDKLLERAINLLKNNTNGDSGFDFLTDKDARNAATKPLTPHTTTSGTSSPPQETSEQELSPSVPLVVKASEAMGSVVSEPLQQTIEPSVAVNLNETSGSPKTRSDSMGSGFLEWI